MFANQEWYDLFGRAGQYQPTTSTEFRLSMCGHCNRGAIWLDDVMVFPLAVEGTEPNSEMPEDVRAVYEEARRVAPLSRKSAAGLLRLALQMLVDDLEPGSEAINTKIGRLVERGLDQQVQQAMDVLRVVGNEAVHPGTIDLDADPELVSALFALINLVVEQMIARPRHVGSLFAKLPQAKLDAIQKRDEKAAADEHDA